MYISIIFAFLICVICTWKYFSTSSNRLPPGPIRWPLFGSILELILLYGQYSFNQMEGLKSRYGSIVSVGLGTHYGVLVNSFDLMKDLFNRPETMNRFEFQVIKDRNKGKNMGITFARGDTWSEMRKYTMKTLREFGFGKGKSIDETIYDEVSQFLAEAQKESQTTGLWKVNKHRISVMTMNILWSAVGGYRFDPKNPLMKRQIELNAEMFEMGRPLNPMLAFSWLKLFPKVRENARKQRQVHWKIEQLTKEMIADVKFRRGEREKPQSFVEVFLDKIEEDRGKSGSKMNNEQLVMILMDLSLGGTDTPSTLMLWMILYFALNPNVQKRARAEISKFSNQGQKRISLKESKNMLYIRACALEAMRHSPFAPSPSPRVVAKDIQCGEYIIPKGTCLYSNMYGHFHDPDVWDHPDVFRPERFLDNSGRMDPIQLEKLPIFGFGKRMCPAEAMSWDILFVFTVSLLMTLQIDVVEDKKPTLEPGVPSLTIGPKPFQVAIRPAKFE